MAPDRARRPPKRARSPTPSSSAAPPPSKSELDDVPAKKPYLDFDPYKPLTREGMEVPNNLVDISEDGHKVFKKEPVNAGKKHVRVDPDKLFDANRSSENPYSPKPVHFKNNPSSFLRLTKCATLAIRDYNLHTQTNYRFVDIEMATWRYCKGLVYHITFRAMNDEKECRNFQATVFTHKEMREVWRIRMKGSSTWYSGTLNERD